MLLHKSHFFAFILVGVRRFPVQTVYIEQLSEALVSNSRTRRGEGLSSIVSRMTNICRASIQPAAKGTSSKLVGEVPIALAKLQYDLATAIIYHVAKPGTSIIVFVPGMADILELQPRFDQKAEMYGNSSDRSDQPAIRSYTVIPIHSEIPFEDQMDALSVPEYDEVKIILATNAAESSVTLPNVEVVICLGKRNLFF
jgi:HrpA-like RNA helicase